jgi:phosphate-selective porin OprO and OprP
MSIGVVMPVITDADTPWLEYVVDQNPYYPIRKVKTMRPISLSWQKKMKRKQFWSHCSKKNIVIVFGIFGFLLGSAYGQAPQQVTSASLKTGIPLPVSVEKQNLDQSLNKSSINEKQAIIPPVASSREAVLEARIKELENAAAERSAREVSLEQRLKALESALSQPASVTASATGTQVPGVSNADQPPGEEALVPPGFTGGNQLPGPNPAQLAPDLNVSDDAVPGYDVVEEPQGVPSTTASRTRPQRNMPFTPRMNTGYAGYGPGFAISSEDDEFQLQIHDLTQIDLRQYNFQTMDPTKSSFGLPRQWTVFNGRLTKPIEYFVALNFGFSNFNLIDAFINLHYDDRFQVKIGRFKTPWSYEFYAEPINGLINPERSIFFNNYGVNRDTGVMLWGQIFNKTTDYAVGVFNGVRNGFEDNNNAKQTMAYLNSRPFEKSEWDLLNYWNIGGSVAYNVYNSHARPDVFRTNIPYPGDPTASPQWLTLNQSTLEFGSQKLWSLHSAWYYNSLSVIAEWYGGYNTYAHQSAPMKGQQVANSGWYAQAGYFLTGEKVTSRGLVSPLRPFNPKSLDGLGAWELGFRWANQSIDKSIFMFAPENRWTNDTDVVDLGVNWYWNDFLKFYIGWQRAMYGKPIQAAPGVSASAPPSYWMSSTDMLWLRAQLYY